MKNKSIALKFSKSLFELYIFFLNLNSEYNTKQMLVSGKLYSCNVNLNFDSIWHVKNQNVWYNKFYIKKKYKVVNIRINLNIWNIYKYYYSISVQQDSRSI